MRKGAGYIQKLHSLPKKHDHKPKSKSDSKHMLDLKNSSKFQNISEFNMK